MSVVLAGAGRTVLIAEDEFLLVLALEEAFAAEAERLAREAPIDAAVLNIRLRDGVVFPAVRPLLDRGIPFVFVSSERIEAPAWMPEAPRFKKNVAMGVVVEKIVDLISRRPAAEMGP